MPDSWILILITVLIFLILFYMSNRMICLSPNSGESSEEKGSENQAASIHYIKSESLPSSPKFMPMNDLSDNNNSKEAGEGENKSRESRVENRLRSQMFNLLLAEKEYQQLEMDVRRLAQVLSTSQGVSPEDCVEKFKKELSPLMEVASFQQQRRSYSMLSNYLQSLTNEDALVPTCEEQNKNDIVLNITNETDDSKGPPNC